MSGLSRISRLTEVEGASVAIGVAEKISLVADLGLAISGMKNLAMLVEAVGIAVTVILKPSIRGQHMMHKDFFNNDH
jgi:hypothetical protein